MHVVVEVMLICSPKSNLSTKYFVTLTPEASVTLYKMGTGDLLAGLLWGLNEVEAFEHAL